MNNNVVFMGIFHRVTGIEGVNDISRRLGIISASLVKVRCEIDEGKNKTN